MTKPTAEAEARRSIPPSSGGTHAPSRRSGLPRTSIDPPHAPTGASSGLRERSSVVLPQPVGPTSTQNSPSSIESDTPSSTVRDAASSV